MPACDTRKTGDTRGKCIPQLDPDVLATALPGGDTVILHLRTSRYFSLNATGSLLWELMRSSADTEAMIQALSDRFEVTPERARESVTELLRELEANQLIGSLASHE